MTKSAEAATQLQSPTTDATSSPDAIDHRVSLYQLADGFAERNRFVSSLDAMREDPAYQRLVSMGEAGAIWILNWTTNRKPSWLLTAVDDITGKDATGIHNKERAGTGLTLEDIDETAHVWGENESLIAIRDEGLRLARGEEAYGLLKDAVFSNQETQEAIIESEFFGFDAVKRPAFKLIDGELVVNGQGMRVSFINDIRGSFETIRLADLGDTELFYAQLHRGYFGKTSRVRFQAQGSQPDTWKAHSEFKKALEDPEVEVISMSARQT